MNAKNQLIQKLLKFGKKHKVFTYPTLALIAIISVFSNFYYWSKGSGKRAVALVLVGVMILSQSYFMTASANESELIEEEETLITDNARDDKEDEKPAKPLVEEEKATEAAAPKEDADEAPADVPDAEDYRDTVTEAPDSDDEAEVTPNEPSAPKDDAEEEETPVDSENYTVGETGKASIIAMKLSTEDAKINNKPNCYFPAGMTEYELKDKHLPKQVSCQIQPADGSGAYWQELDVSWHTIKCANTNGGMGEFTPEIKSANQYESITDDYTNTKITVYFKTRYEVEFVDYGEGTLGDNGFIDGKYGFVGSDCVYKLPTVTRKKKDDASMNVPFDGWYLDSVQWAEGANFSTESASSAKLTFHARYSEAEVTLVDETAGITEYEYPKKGDTFTLNRRLKSTIDGYRFLGWTGSKISGTQTEVSIENIDDTTLTASWAPREYVIVYHGNMGPGNDPLKSYTYKYNDTDVKYKDVTDTEFKYPGHQFVGWTVSADGTGSVAAAGTDFPTGTTVSWPSNEEEVPTVSVYAKWEEKAIVYEDGQTGDHALSKNMIYGTAYSETFALTTGGDKDTYSITETPTLSSGTIEEYFETLSVTASGSQVTFSAIPKKMWADTLVLTYEVNDTDAGFAESLTLALAVDKKTLTVSGITVNEKTYDGLLAVPDTEITKIALDGIYGSDIVSVNKTGITAKYNDKDASQSASGNDKTVILVEPTLTGDAAGNYILETAADGSVTIENAARINKRPLHIHVADTITQYVGESAPSKASRDLEITYDDDVDDATKALVAADGGLPIADNEKPALTIHYDSSVALPPAGGEVTVDVHASAKNYQVNCEGSCKLKVVQDPAEEGVTYEVLYDKYNDVQDGLNTIRWYNGTVTINPLPAHEGGYYNQIVVKDEAAMPESIVIDDDSSFNDRDFVIALRNKDTHAITSDSETLHFKVDSTAPVKLDGYPVFTSASGSVLKKIGNFFKYGNFFQESVVATLAFDDAKSGCKTLYYKTGADGEPGDGSWTMKSIENEKETTIEIVLGTKNVVRFYAEDVAGNVTPVWTLLGDEDGDEWVIERNKPELYSFHIENLDGDRITNLSNGMWYNQPVQVVAEILESDSGVQYADWYVNGATTRVGEEAFNRSETRIPMVYPFKESGIYEVAIDVVDNANNAMGKTGITTLQIDLEGPEITVNEDEASPDSWQKTNVVTFTVSDAVSGIDKVSVLPPEGAAYAVNPVSDGTYQFTATKEGDYVIYARDAAGNETSKKITIDKISNVSPANGSVKWTPEVPDGGSGWYVTRPFATITPSENTGVPRTTYYKLWKGMQEPNQATAVTKVTDVTLPEDGVWTLKVWTESATGVTSQGLYTETVYVDTEAPQASVTSVKATGEQQNVIFTVKDAYSGVDVDKLKVVNGSSMVASTITAFPDGSGYQVEITVSSPGSYVLQTCDKAGNASETAAFMPMTMKVNAVKNITENSAFVSNVVKKGSFDIASVTYQYKRAKESAYGTVTPLTEKDAAGNVSASYSFQNLDPETKYDYKITATSAVGEVLSYTGSFKTLGANGINVTGVVVDADDASSQISVSLQEGNTTLQTVDIKSGETFTFTKVPDGNYNIVASNGMTSKTLAVTVTKGKVVDPKGDILITLRNGQITSVSITGSKTPNVSVSGLEDIFLYDTVNFTEDDRQFIAEGGTVEFRLAVNYTAAGSVTQKALAAIYSLMGKDEKVNMFINLNLYKIRTYASGTVESKKQITELSGGVVLRITVPLADKVKKATSKSILRVHNDSASVLADLGASATSYTIESSQFSTYAIVYAVDKDSSKTDEPSSEKTTEEYGDGEQDDKPDKDTDTDKDKDDGKGGSIKKYDSTPKTGDEAPIAGAALMLTVSLFGVVLLKKKAKPCK